MKRLVVKVGSSSLTDATGRIEPPKLWAVARAVLGMNAEVAVVSSGAVAAGRGVLGLPKPSTLPQKQALAAVGQAALMQEWARAFAPRPVAQFLLSAGDIQDRRRFVNAKHALESAFRLGAVPIVNENDTVATQELRLGDNDTLSAWVAYLADAEELLLLTDVDGLFSADPAKDPAARQIPLVERVADVLHLAGGSGGPHGTGGMHTKLRAAQIASDAGIDTVILGGGGRALERLFGGEYLGTRVRAGKPAARRGWLLHQAPKGTLHLDAGAAEAVRSGRSLLPKGVLGVRGHFAYGDVVRLEGPEGAVAQGLVNYASDEVARILGLNTGEIEGALGRKDFDEVMHRNQLALL